jgi:hypothetical protein
MQSAPPERATTLASRRSCARHWPRGSCDLSGSGAALLRRAGCSAHGRDKVGLSCLEFCPALLSLSGPLQTHYRLRGRVRGSETLPFCP